MKPKKALLLEFLSVQHFLLKKGYEETLSALPPGEIIQAKAELFGNSKVTKTAPVLIPIKEALDRVEHLIELLTNE